MCSFLILNFIIKNFDWVNYFQKFRGPDLTHNFNFNNFFFYHNLLHITGEVTKQPFIDEDNQIVALFNGEIYNYKEFGNYKSDGFCLIDLYKKYNTNFVKYLDGEYAICLFDFKKNIFIISTDVFSKKPLWYSIGNDKLGLASYESALKRSGLENRKKLLANTTLIYNLETFELIEEKRVYEFKFNQFKNTYDDWCKAFVESVRKRVDNDNYPVFVCLSSGYDSGAICCALNILKKKYYTYTIIASENIDIINKRIEINKENTINHQIVSLEVEEFLNIKKYIDLESEKFYYSIDGCKPVTEDKASVGMSKICSLATIDKTRIYLSGQGADEIVSDYGNKGKKLSSHSGFGGLYPTDLNQILSNDPKEEMVWRSFYKGSQESYLSKEEIISGLHGIEGRYPYLDKDLVQEFLNLTPELKNRIYKAPLDYFLEKNNYPFEKGIKIGFSCDPRTKFTSYQEKKKKFKNFFKKMFFFFSFLILLISYFINYLNR